jgi:hypothetical protein
MEPLKLSLARICEVSGESLHVVYAAISAGHLTTFVVGRRRFARPEAVRAWVDYLEAQSKAGKPVVYRPRSGERSAA